MVMDKQHVYDVFREAGIEHEIAARLADVLETNRSRLLTKDDLDAASALYKSNLDGAISRLDVQIIALDEKFDREVAVLRSDLDNAVSRLDVRITALDEKIDREVAVLHSDIQQLREDVASLRREMADLRRELTDLRRDLDERDRRLRQELDARIESLRREMRWAFGVLFTLVVTLMGIVIGFGI